MLASGRKKERKKKKIQIRAFSTMSRDSVFDLEQIQISQETRRRKDEFNSSQKEPVISKRKCLAPSQI